MFFLSRSLIISLKTQCRGIRLVEPLNLSVSSWVSNSSFFYFDFVRTIDYELPRRKEIRMSYSVDFSTNYLPVSIIESRRTGKTGVKIGIHQINYYNDRRCNR